MHPKVPPTCCAPASMRTLQKVTKAATTNTFKRRVYFGAYIFDTFVFFIIFIFHDLFEDFFQCMALNFLMVKMKLYSVLFSMSILKHLSCFLVLINVHFFIFILVFTFDMFYCLPLDQQSCLPLSLS